MKTKKLKNSKTRKAHKTHLAFTRKDTNRVENLVVLKITHSPKISGPKEVFEALCKGITSWVEETEHGKNLWQYTCEDLNIGDILGEHKDKKLAKYLKIQGIKKWKPIYELVDQEEISYDRVLAHPKDPRPSQSPDEGPGQTKQTSQTPQETISNT